MYGFMWDMGNMFLTPYSSGGMTPDRYQDDFLSKGIYTSMLPSLATFRNVSFLTAPERVKFNVLRLCNGGWHGTYGAPLDPPLVWSVVWLVRPRLRQQRKLIIINSRLIMEFSLNLGVLLIYYALLGL